jgi:integrase
MIKKVLKTGGAYHIKLLWAQVCRYLIQKHQSLNKDNFKTLWSSFKRRSKLLEQAQTLYSFRHSGAIEIFKRTGSITKLQKAMGHSSINVSLTYLRGLEIAELKEEEDMPMV